MIRRLYRVAAASGLLAIVAGSPALAESADPLAPVDSAPVIVTGRMAAPASPDIFGTVALDAGVTVYGARWRRVSAADANDPRLVRLMAGAAGLDPLAKLDFVQREVNRRIGWRRDLDIYRVSDYWAQAGETLDRGQGDSEDIAVLKMQALKAAGFNARDFYLSVGRDVARGADTLLLVRVGNAFYALDDRSDRALTPAEHGRFVPIITLGKNAAWLHGKRFAGGSRSRHRIVMASSRVAR